MLGWLVDEHGIEPHVTVFDKSTRKDGTSRARTSTMIRLMTFISALAARR
jgi:hypothetical protein